jgi:hypothetical protein
MSVNENPKPVVPTLAKKLSTFPKNNKKNSAVERTTAIRFLKKADRRY